MKGHFLQLIATSSKRHELSVLLRRKGEKEQGLEIKESTVSFQNCFGVVDEGRKDKVTPLITPRD